MYRLRSFANEIHARSAADWLRRNGILAMVVSGVGDVRLFDITRGSHHLMIPGKDLAEQAQQILDEFEETEADLPEDWEDVRPDLTCLDPALSPPCPACERLLSLDASLERCPSCGQGVDVVDLLIAKHGPDILTDCYPEECTDNFEDLADQLSVWCVCGYELEGLAGTGRCPECGQWYDKNDVIRAILDR